MKRVFCTLLACLMIFCMVQPAAYAKNACIAVSGSAADCNTWKKITVITDKNWGSNKVKFTQTTGTLTYQFYSPGQFVSNAYGAYTIRVKDQSTGKTKEYYWKYQKNYTLKLEDNKTYTIEVKPYQPATVGDQKYKTKTLATKIYQTFGWRGYNKSNWYWYEAPTWEVVSTKAVNWCYTPY